MKINAENVKNSLNTKIIGKQIEYFDEIGSTNDYAKAQTAENGTVYIADKQTSGKGRRGRTWLNPKSTNIAMTIYLKPEINPQDIAKITLVTGLAAAKAVNELCGVNSKIKWPNDLVINGRKICGILTEMVTSNNEIKCVAVGIGINVNSEDFPREIIPDATSLYIETGKKQNRSDIIKKILETFEEYYIKMLDGKTSEIMEEYESLCVNIGKKVKAVYETREIFGIAKKITPSGGLMIETEDGQDIEISYGEVSVRGIYGYCD